ncbi:MAG TPA: fatty acyl-AMP ligase [Kofleriaceae bacterium]|nr:fatty acyl-AMP ligase [Kofleriaceae bacterium]
MSLTQTINRVFRDSFPEAERSNFRTAVWAYGVPETPEDLVPLHPTLLHALATAAKLEESVGITLLPEKDGGEEQHVSYRRLYHDATRISVNLARLGVGRGDRVLMVLPTSIEFVSCFFAIQLLKAIPVPAYPPVGLRMKAGLEKLAAVATRAGTRLCITSARLRPLLGDLLLRAPIVNRLATTDEIGRGAEPDDRFRASGDDEAFIQFTSGSTGNPKGVLLTQHNLVTNIHAIGQALHINRADIGVSWLPLYHDMGLIGVLLFCVYWRLPLVLMSPTAFLARPSRWLWAIHRFKGTLSPAPNFGYGLCVSRVSDEEREGLDLSSWRFAMNGAEPVNYRTLVDFEKTYATHGFSMSSLYPVYGLAESSLAVTFPRPGAGVRYEVVDRQELANGRAVLASGKGSMAVVSVGRAVPGHFVAVVDETGAPLPEREVGHVVVLGNSIMTGYYEDADATARVLREGWLWTGDLGYFADRNLYITGRAKDLIIIRGRNIYAEDLERVAERVPGVRPGSAVAFGIEALSGDGTGTERAVLVAETRARDRDERDALASLIRQRISEFCDVELHDVVIASPGTVPKTSSGKRQRSQCKQLYLAEELRPARASRLSVGLVVARSKLGLLMRRLRRPPAPDDQ